MQNLSSDSAFTLHHQFKAFLRGIPVLAVQEGVQDLFQETQTAPVADGGEVAVADAVHDGEAEPHQGDVFIPGDVFHIGIAHEQVHRIVFDPLVQQKHVAGALDVDRMGHVLGNLLDPGFELLARGAGDDMNGPHVDGHQKLGEGNEMIRVPRQGHLAAIEVLLHVGDDVQEPAAFDIDGVGHGYPGDPS